MPSKCLRPLHGTVWLGKEFGKTFSIYHSINDWDYLLENTEASNSTQRFWHRRSKCGLGIWISAKYPRIFWWTCSMDCGEIGCTKENEKPETSEHLGWNIWPSYQFQCNNFPKLFFLLNYCRPRNFEMITFSKKLLGDFFFPQDQNPTLPMSFWCRSPNMASRAEPSILGR